MIRMKPAVRTRKAKHSREAEELLQTIDNYINDNEKGVAEVLTYFWKDQQDAITYGELRALVMNGYVTSDQVRQWQQDYSVLVQNKLNGVWDSAMVYGSESQPALSSRGFSMNTMLPGATKWLKEHGAEFVTNCTEQQKGAIAHLLQYEMMQKHSVEEIARMIRPCIGLTKGQTSKAEKIYSTVKETLRKEHPRMKQSNVELKALKAAQKYAEKAHRQRAETIAQTELAKAYNHGAHEGIRQAQQMGLMGAVKKVWCTANDHRVCPHCEALDGKTVGFDEGFGWSKYLFSDSDELPPAHPLCRCAIQYIEIEPEGARGRTSDFDDLFDYGDNDSQSESMTLDDLFDRIYLENITGSRQYADGALNAISGASDETRQLFGRYAGKIQPHYETIPKDSNYDPTDNRIYVNMRSVQLGGTSLTPYQALYHEVGHNIDYLMGQEKGYPTYYSCVFENGILGKTVEKEAMGVLKSFYKANLKDIEDNLSKDLVNNAVKDFGGKKAQKELKSFNRLLRRNKAQLEDVVSRENIMEAMFKNRVSESGVASISRPVKEAMAKQYTPRQIGDVSDMLEYWFKIDKPFGSGHGVSYWETGGDVLENVSTEAFANIFSADMANKDSIDLIKSIFPDTYSVFLRMIGE